MRGLAMFKKVQRCLKKMSINWKTSRVSLKPGHKCHTATHGNAAVDSSPTGRNDQIMGQSILGFMKQLNGSTCIRPSLPSPPPPLCFVRAHVCLGDPRIVIVRFDSGQDAVIVRASKSSYLLGTVSSVSGPMQFEEVRRVLKRLHAVGRFGSSEAQRLFRAKIRCQLPECECRYEGSSSSIKMLSKFLI